MRQTPSRHALAAAVVAVALLVGSGGMAVFASASVVPKALSGPPAAGPAAVPSAMPTLYVPAPARARKPAPKKAKRLTLAQLRAEVKRTDAELAARTKAWQRGRLRLVAAQRQLAVIRIEAVRAHETAVQAHDALGRYAAAAYRGQQVPTDVAVLLSPGDGAEQTIHNLQNLEQAGATKADIATYAAAAAARSNDLARRASNLTAETARTARVLAAQRAAIVARAKAVQKQLTAEVRRIAIAAAKQRDATCQAKAKIAAQFPNGLIPLAVLCPIGVGPHLLRGDAAVTFLRLAAAYKADLGEPICVNSSYRNRELQARLYADDPVMVALPGRSHHGLGLAVDFCGGIENFGSAQHRWMKKHAGEFGWYHPSWAEPSGVTPEPWHWEFRGPLPPAA